MRELVRRARLSDHATYARLFRELGTDDAMADEARFEREMMPTMVVADDVGYAFFVVIGDSAHVSHLAVAPEARRRGVASALMEEVAARARDAGCRTWRLNVKVTNTGAIAFYERLGLARAFESCALKIEWRVVPEGPNEGRRVDPNDDERVERALEMLPGQLAQARAARRIPIVIERAGAIAAATFDPTFPGASVFRASPELAVPLLRAMRAHALPEHDFVGVKIEDQPETARTLIDLGALVRFRMFHMVGTLRTT
jgi:GNAT superfamily N-acetyltransferase